MNETLTTILNSANMALLACDTAGAKQGTTLTPLSGSFGWCHPESRGFLVEIR